MGVMLRGEIRVVDTQVGQTLSSWELTEAPSRESKLTLSLLGRGTPNQVSDTS